MKDSRLNKINTELRNAVAEIIQNDLNDPRINGIISVLKVSVDKELYQATTYVSIYNAKDKEETFQALQSSAGYIRKLLSQKIDIRNTPIIKFVLDKNFEYSEEINELLSKIDIPNDIE